MAMLPALSCLYPEAQLGLDTMYRHGWGIQRSYHDALDWYKRSAAHGNSDAMNNIGYMYYNGLGTSMNAEMYYRLAAWKGHKRAQKALNEMEQDIPAEETDSVFTMELMAD